MERNPLKVLLDSNIIVSALVFGGKPQTVVRLVLKGSIIGYISQSILTEIVDAIIEKFDSQRHRLYRLEKRIRKKFTFVYPHEEVNIIRDPDDNKVLEAAVEGACEYIITGYKDLLSLKEFRTIRIVTSQEFLKMYGKSSSG